MLVYISNIFKLTILSFYTSSFKTRMPKKKYKWKKRKILGLIGQIVIESHSSLGSAPNP